MKLSVIGRGIRPWEHLTLAGLRALKNADVVLGIEPDNGAWQALSQEFSLPAIKSIDFLYRDGATDSENYKAFVAFVADVCTQYENVALVVAGHPRLGVSVSQWFSSNALPADIEVEFIEGISSFDAMFNDLACDPLEKGTLVVDANRLLLFNYVLDPAVDIFIYHVSSVGNVRTDFIDCTRSNRLTWLARYLSEYFPPDKKIVLCKAANKTGDDAEYVEITLDSLVENSKQIDPGTTLFIAGEKPKQLNPKFLNQLRSSHDSAAVYC